MSELSSSSPFRRLAWFVPVCLLVLLAAVLRSWVGTHFPEHTLRDVVFRSFAFVLPLAGAILLTQRIILARSHHPRAFAGVLAACLVAMIGILGFLALLVFATFFAPASPI